MKYFGPLFFILLLTGQLIHAQQTDPVSGTVIDSTTRRPLVAATVALQRADKHQIIKTMLTDNQGHFEFHTPLIPQIAYQLLVSHVGYTGINRAVPAPGKDIGEIMLPPVGNTLHDVTVSASRPLVKQEIDRLAYDVQADPQTKGLTAMEMLRRVPLVTVDGDDNIQLQGSGNFLILVNDKPSAIVTNNPKDVLRAMPATAILRIEVITTPPAKYDAEGLAGIINIITVKKTTDNYSGTLSGRLNNIYGGSLGFSGTAKIGKLGVSLLETIAARPWSATEQENIRKGFGAAPNLLYQDVTENNKGYYINSGFEISQEFDTLHLLTASFNIAVPVNRTNDDRSTSYQSPPGTVVQTYDLHSHALANNTGVDAGLNYQLGFAHRKDRLLTASARYSYSLSKAGTDLALFNKMNYSMPDNHQQNNVKNDEYTLQLDYVHAVKKLNIEGGAKAIFRNIHTLGEVDDLISGVYNFDAANSNSFSYRQNIYSIYNSYTLKLGKLIIQAGLRAEHTVVHADFISTATTADKTYYNVIPTLSLLKTLRNNNTIRFGFANRLYRPGAVFLNPFIDRSNPQLLTTGNPNLQPVTSHLAEMNYNIAGKGSLNLRLAYYFANHTSEVVTHILSDSTSLTTRENIGKNEIARFDVTGNYPIGKKISVNFNTGVFYVWITGVYNGQFYSNRGPRTNTFANFSYKLSPMWQFGLSGGYNRRYINLQGGSNDYYYNTISATCNLKKITLTAGVNNPLATHYTFTTYNSAPDFYQGNTSHLLYRNIYCNLGYRFGKLTSGLKKNRRGISNDDTQSN